MFVRCSVHAHIIYYYRQNESCHIFQINRFILKHLNTILKTIKKYNKKYAVVFTKQRK